MSEDFTVTKYPKGKVEEVMQMKAISMAFGQDCNDDGKGSGIACISLEAFPGNYVSYPVSSRSEMLGIIESLSSLMAIVFPKTAPAQPSSGEAGL